MADFDVTLAHNEFRNLLHNVGLACADSRGGRPVYESILLTVQGGEPAGKLTAEGTNGHILFRQSMGGEVAKESDSPASVLFRATDAQGWIRAVKPGPSSRVVLSVTSSQIELLTDNGTARFTAVEGVFPNTERLWIPAIEARDCAEGGVPQIMFSTPLLGAVAKLKLGDTTRSRRRSEWLGGPFVRFAFRSELAPVYVWSNPDNFDGLLMPARPTDAR